MYSELKDTLMGLPHDVVCEGFELMFRDKSGPGEVHVVHESGSKVPELKDFVSLIKYMKMNYSFPELENFNIEGEVVLYRKGGRRIEISQESVSGFSPDYEYKRECDKEPGNCRSDECDSESRFSRLEL